MSETALMPGWLPWDRNSDEELLLRKALVRVIGASLLLGVLVPLITVPERAREEAEAIPPRLARMLLEREVPPPPPPAPVESRAEEIPVEEKSAPEGKPAAPVAAARRKAAQSGVLALSQQLAALSAMPALGKATAHSTLSSGGSEATRSEFAMERNAGKGSGGIDTSALVREDSSGPLPAEHETTVLVVAKDELASIAAPEQTPARSADAIHEVLDRNKGAIYVIYDRALRRNALLAGNVVFAITIEPSGRVSGCRVVSSELQDEDLERKLAARIAMIDFGAQAVPQITVKWPLSFLPQ